MAQGTLYTIATDGWWEEDNSNTITAIATDGWFIGPPSEVVESEDQAGQFGDFYFRVPTERSSPEEWRRSLQDCQRLLKRVTRFLPEAGTAFPAEPGHGKPFYDTDEGIWYIYLTDIGWIPAFEEGFVPVTEQFQTIAGDNLVFISGDDWVLIESGT